MERYSMNGHGKLNELFAQVHRVVVVQPATVRLAIAALLAQGHVLLEDVPGTGKTLFARTLAGALGGTFKRIQFTPDLLPGDITGGYVYNQKTSEFNFVAGPVFANVVLADEINRATPKTQSSLLEAMAESQVTAEGETKPLPKPFLVIATENPIESYGTFPLPEAQLDRFAVRLSIGYPGEVDELAILDRSEHGDLLANAYQVLTPDDVVDLQARVRAVKVAATIKQYIVRLVRATRADSDVVLGASPRGGVMVQRLAQAIALIEGRDFVLPDDVKEVIVPALVHRLTLRNRHDPPDALVSRVVNMVPVPVGVPLPATGR